MGSHPANHSFTTNRIQKVQNSYLRFIFGNRKYDRISHNLKAVGWLNMWNSHAEDVDFSLSLSCIALFHTYLKNIVLDRIFTALPQDLED